jgi:hypothetical protein
VKSVSDLLVLFACAVGACSKPDSPLRDADRSDSISIDAMGVRVAAWCYRSPHSVLLGPPTRAGQQGKSPGWLGVEVPQRADSGWAVLAEPGSKRFDAFWRRDSTDSVRLIAGDDFLKLEMRLAVSESLATGSALARSDAALEPDSSGRLADLRRVWTFRAVRAPCDSMPSLTRVLER